MRAYHPATGQILWEDEVDKGDAIDDIACAVALAGEQVFVAGTTNAPATRWNLLLRAYHAPTGALLWEHQRAGVYPNAMIARAGRVFVAGLEGASTFLAAFNATHGGVLWEDTPTPGGFVDVKMQYQRVVAVGHPLVRVYHAATGTVLWQDRTAPAPVVRAVAVSDKAVYVTGYATQEDLWTFLVRAYDLVSGQVLFDERSHESAPYGGSAGFAIALGITHVYAVGRASDGGSQDFLIRAYARQAIEPQRK
jgi:outer membrane protein assembly factor BamB